MMVRLAEDVGAGLWGAGFWFLNLDSDSVRYLCGSCCVGVFAGEMRDGLMMYSV